MTDDDEISALQRQMDDWRKGPRQGLSFVEHESDVAELTSNHRLSYRLIRGLSMLAQENR